MQTSELKRFLRTISLATVAVLAGASLITAGVYAILGDSDINRLESPFLIAKEGVFRADPTFNTVFVGSSITFRQIDPAIFDAELADSFHIRSYNLGNDGLYATRSIDYLEYLLSSAPPGLETIFVELFRLDEIMSNYDAPEIMRVTGYRNYYQSVRTIIAANFPRRHKVWLLAQYTRSFVYKALGFGLINYVTLERQLRPQHLERLAVADRGFYAKDIELLRSRDQANIDTLKFVRADFESNPELVDVRRRLHLDKYRQQWMIRPNPFSERLLELIRRADSQGIRLVYILPPLMDTRGISFAYPAWLVLPESHRLDLSDPVRYPELYDYRNLFDIEHVNSTGSRWFTRYLAGAYRAQLEAEAVNE